MVKLLPTDEHAWKIDCILRTLVVNDFGDEWEHICNWLEMASSIDNVGLITEKFDSSLLFCSSARKFQDERSTMLSALTKELTVFNFIWGAFESLLETLEPLIIGCDIDNFGKISTARYILRKKNNYGLLGYRESLDKLIKLYTTLINKKVDHSKVNFNEKGLFIVYKIRNKFAHGAYSFPDDPEDYPVPTMTHTALINISSTIVLLTMQMLLISYFYQKDIKLDHLFLFDGLYDEETIELNTLLKFIHRDDFIEMITNK